MENILNFSGLATSFLGIALLIVNKIPILLESNPSKFKKKKSIIIKLRPFFEKIAEKINSFSFYGTLHKILSKIKILNLKAEKITDFWLSKIRQRHIQEKEKEEKEEREEKR